VDLIKEFEGYADELPDGRAAAYRDPIYGWDVPTIGYGTTRYPDGTPVRRGDIITPQQAETYLVSHIDEATRPDLERIPTWPRMNNNQRSALYSFAYNLGSRFYGQSGFASITRVCDSPDAWNDAAWIRAQFVKYINPGTAAEAGLRRRRLAEADLFLS
jgi:GH24 family phage-related lysozyme (muramidase)